MKNLSREIDANYRMFSTAWYEQMERAYSSLQAQDSQFRGVYKRLVSLQAWRSELLETISSPDALGFFLEAQNDGLVSLVLSRMGSCRVALQSLRSCLENVLYAAYYMDHSVELKLWHSGKHRLAFSQLESYFKSHPTLDGISSDIHGLDALSAEYSTLSRAVHGTAASFRMSVPDVGTQLWSDDPSRVGKYETRQKFALTCLNQLLLCLFRVHLQGTSHPNLRKAVSLSIPSSKYRKLKTELGITLFSP